MTNQPSGNGTLAYRVERLEDTQKELREEVKGLRQLVTTLILVVIAATLTFAISATVYLLV